MTYWLRWLAVLPGALLGGLLATVALRLVLYSTLRSFVDPYPEWPERLLTPFVIAIAVVWFGAWIAPSHKLRAAIVLFGLWMVLLGAVVAFTILAQQSEAVRLRFQLGGLPAALTFVGGLFGVLIVQKQGKRQNVGIPQPGV